MLTYVGLPSAPHTTKKWHWNKEDRTISEIQFEAKFRQNFAYIITYFYQNSQKIVSLIDETSHFYKNLAKRRKD